MSLFTNDAITSLEPHTTAKIRSTQILTSLSQLVSELVQNSLDAGASHIEVGIDPAEWECWVRDDGHGISVEGMESFTKGHDKGRYNTSKAYGSPHVETNTFGFRGEALASVMELACLEISSRTSQARESWSVILKGGEQLYSGPSLRWRREKTGTTIVCRDIFFNVPVRRRAHQNTARTLELTKKEIETLALVFPGVSFSLEHTNSTQKARILTIPKTNSSLATCRALYGKAVVERVEEINIRSEDLTLDGFISLNGSHSRGLQNFYVNKHPINFGEIQRAIEKRFATSTFGRFAANEDVQFTARMLLGSHHSPRKTERKPVYVLNLTIAPNQDTNRVVAFVLEVINRFLARNGLISAFATRLDESNKSDRCHGSPRKRIRLETPRPTLQTEEPPSPVALNGSQGTTSSHPFRSLLTHQEEEGTETHGTQDDSGYFEWIDPSSRESFLVDADTGNSFSSHIPGCMRSEVPSNDNDSGELVIHSNRRRLKLNEQNAEARPAPPTWLANALKRNTTFNAVDQTVFAMPAVNLNPRAGAHPHVQLCQPLDSSCVSNMFQSSQLTSQTFSREDLKSSQVIAQVDTKFVACILHPSSKSQRVLALIDQHAADERVRVERYLKETCSGFLRGETERVELKPSIKILLTRRETELLERTRMRSAILRWGLCIERCVLWPEAGLAQDHDFIQVDVTAVPKVVSKKVAKHELSEFTKAMVAALETDGFSHWPIPLLANQDSSWVKALRFCPAPLFELINSRACRGAIMFNDPLNQHQCQRLIAQLAGTVFPFQCAHGRPSIAPLIELDNAIPQRDSVDWWAFELGDV